MSVKIFYLDEFHNFVPEDEATTILEVELDEMGHIISKTFSKPEKEE